MNGVEIKGVLEKYLKDNPDYLSDFYKNILRKFYNDSDSEKKEWMNTNLKNLVRGLNLDFVDWCELVKTFNVYMRDFILREYPLSDGYKKVLCVGDGEKCHLGRKLAMQGYRVVSVDPMAQKNFSCSNIRAVNNNGKGSIFVVKRPFTEDSIDMINWADIIVGSKVPMLAETLLKMPKPVIFNVSANSEIHNISFGGKKVESGENLQQWISNSKGVHTFEMDSESRWKLGYSTLIFVKDLERDQRRNQRREMGDTRY